MRSVDFASEQQTASALLPVRGERRQVKHHERATGFAVGCGAAQGGLEEVGQLCGFVVSMFLDWSNGVGSSYLRVAIRYMGLSFSAAQSGDNIAQA